MSESGSKGIIGRNGSDDPKARESSLTNENGDKKESLAFKRASRVSVTSCGVVLNQENEHSLTMLQTIIHVIKGNVGPGMLALPRAVSLAGLWVGSIGIVFLSLFCIQCMHLIVECSQRLCVKTGKSSMSYADVAEFTLSTSSNKSFHKYSKIFRNVINVFLCFTQLGFCCVYFVFIPQNIFEVLKPNDCCVEYYPLMAITLVPILIVMTIRNLDWLAPCSMIANLLLLFGLIMISFYTFQDLPPMSEVPAFGAWSGLPIYFATTIYSFEGIGCILPIENQMKEPKKMVAKFGTINIAMGLVTCIYIVIGFFGYWHFSYLPPEEIEGSITLNLPTMDWEAQSTKVTMACAVFLTYPLQAYPAIEVLLPVVQKRFSERFSLITELVFRYCLVAVTFGLAAAIPKIDLFIALIGAVASSTLALIAPSLIHTLVFWDDFNGTSGKIKIARNMFLLFLGVIGMVAGTIYSVKDIVVYFVEPQDGGNFPKCDETSSTNESSLIPFVEILQSIVPNTIHNLIKQ